MVEFDLEKLSHQKYKAIGLPLIATTLISEEIKNADPIGHSRSLIRHNNDILARELVRICQL